jgi:hypothetical protein
MIWLILLPILSLILWVLVKAFTTTPSQKLNKQFVELGILKGKSYSEIVSVVGEANSKDYISNDTILCQWIQPAYHICLLFDENWICLGVQSETKIDE